MCVCMCKSKVKIDSNKFSIIKTSVELTNIWMVQNLHYSYFPEELKERKKEY